MRCHYYSAGVHTNIIISYSYSQLVNVAIASASTLILISLLAIANYIRRLRFMCIIII